MNNPNKSNKPQHKKNKVNIETIKRHWYTGIPWEHYNQTYAGLGNFQEFLKF